MTHSVTTYFMGLFGYKTVPITVSAKAIIQQTGSTGPDSSSGPFKYALFSKNDLTLSGNKTVKGSVHTDSNLSWSGNKTITQTVEGKTVSISGNTTVANNGTPGSIIAQTPSDITISGNYNHNVNKLGGCDTNIAMPDYSDNIANIVADKQSLSNYTISGNVDLTNSIYNDGNITLSGNIDSTGAILATGDITISGNIDITGATRFAFIHKMAILLLVAISLPAAMPAP